MNTIRSVMAKGRRAGGDRPLIVHLIYRLDYGGMETVLVDLINQMGDSPYRHAVICLKDYTEFRQRIVSAEVEVIALGKREGKDIPNYFRLINLLIRMRPDIVNTYSIATLDLTVLARSLGAQVVHAEHGWQLGRDEVSPKYIRMRRLVAPFISRYIAVSLDLMEWLRDTVGLPERKLVCIYNGVNPERFKAKDREQARLYTGLPREAYVVGTVARLAPVKAQDVLIDAFARLRALCPQSDSRLVIVGDGPERSALETRVKALNLGNCVWFAGARSDVPEWLSSFDVFTLPSRNEGISIAILEAMACGLPVVATHVGGNPEVVVDQDTGLLVPPNDLDAQAEALACYCKNPNLKERHGTAGRARMLAQFSLISMANRYLHLYDELLGDRSVATA